MGSNKVLRVALGHDEADEHRLNLSRLSENISGSVGLFFTNLPKEQVRGAYRAMCFALATVFS